MRYLNFSLLLCLVGWCTGCTNDADVETTGGVNTIAATLDEKIPRWQEELNVPNVGLGIIEDGEITTIKVYGQLPDDRKAPQNTLFNIASVTKVVFGTLVLKMVESGAWDLDQPLYRYYVDPEVQDDPYHKKLTTRHVLSQQSGFVNWRMNHPTGQLTFDFEPGTTFNYSGEGMEYLRLAIESKFQKTWSELADSLLFEPLEMVSTKHAWDGKSAIERFSYWYDAAGALHDVEEYSTMDNAADDIMTTVRDLSLFGLDVLGGAGLSPALFEEMVSQQAVINPNLDQGLAWRVINGLPNDEYAIQHGGNDIGVATLLLLLPKSKRGLVIFTNSDAGIVMCNNIVRTAFPEGTEIIHRAYKSTPLDETPTVVTVDAKILAKYVGSFQQPSGRTAVISQGENSLILSMPGVPNLQFLPASPTQFFLLDFDAKMEFVDEQDGLFQQLNILEGENTIACQRVGQ